MRYSTVGFTAAILVLFSDFAALSAEIDPATAVRAHLNCVADQVANLDDGKMTPGLLARMILPLCHDAHVAAMKATNGDVDAKDVEYYHTLAAVQLARSRRITR